jgi:enoyl-CoA hydratase/carnithine racemase
VIETIRHGDVRELRMDRAPVNALNPALVQALRDALAQACTDGARAIVLSGRTGLFSAGLDVPELIRLDRARMQAFWTDFFALCADLARAPVPVAAAIGGHSPAGGAVLAIHCDYRIMARGAFRIGLNETQVGLVVPEAIQRALRRLVGAHRAERLLVAGAMLDAGAALACGFVDELADPAAVTARAIAWCEELLHLPPAAMLATRAIARADLAAIYADPAALPIDAFLDGWFAPETQAVLRALVARLGK